MSKKIQKMFDQVARRYDFLNHFMSAGRDLAWRKKAIQKMLKTMKSTQFLASPNQKIKVLDLCGGTGDLIQSLHKSYPHIKLSVLGDFSFPMLSHAQKKDISTFPLQCDALQLPFTDNSFDIVMCGYGMRNLDNLTIAISEIARVIKPKGFFMTLEFFRPVKIIPTLFYKVLAPLFVPVLGALLAKQKEAYQYLIQSICQFYSVQEYQKKCLESFNQSWTWACDASTSDIVLTQKK